MSYMPGRARPFSTVTCCLVRLRMPVASPSVCRASIPPISRPLSPVVFQKLNKKATTVTLEYNISLSIHALAWHAVSRPHLRFHRQDVDTCPSMPLNLPDGSDYHQGKYTCLLSPVQTRYRCHALRAIISFSSLRWLCLVHSAPFRTPPFSTT